MIATLLELPPMTDTPRQPDQPKKRQASPTRYLQQLLRTLPHLYLSDDLDTRELACTIEGWLSLLPENQARLLLWYAVLDRPLKEPIPAHLDPRYWRWVSGRRVETDWRRIMRIQAQNELRRTKDRDLDGESSAWDSIRRRNGIEGPTIWRQRIDKTKFESLPTWFLYLVENRQPPAPEMPDDTKRNNARKKAYYRALAALLDELRTAEMSLFCPQLT